MPDVRTTTMSGAFVTRDVEPSGQTELERMRAEVVRSRNRFGSSLAELERRVSVGTNWRHWVRTHPWAAVSLGIGAGYLVGHWRSRRAPRPR